MIDPSLLSLCSSAIEATTNKALQYDPGSRLAIAELSGTRFEIQVSDINLAMTISIVEQRMLISLSPCSDSELDTNDTDLRLIGKTSNFIKLLTSTQHSLSGSGVKAEGKVSLLKNMQSIVSTLDIDWEDAIAQTLGPLAAGPLGIVTKQLNQQLRSMFKSSGEQFKEYSQYESDVLVTQLEFESFSEDLTGLRERTERLLAKFEQLKTTVLNNEDTP